MSFHAQPGPEQAVDLPIVTASGRDAGLLRAMGVGPLTFAIIGIVVGAGIFALPSQLAASVGLAAPLVLVGCALAVGCVALCFAEGGSRVPTSGGAYGYVAEAFGPLAAYVAGTLLWVGNLLANGGIAAAMAAVGASLAPASAVPLMRSGLIVVTIGAIAWLNITGVRHGARLISLTTLAKLLPLAVFVGAGVMSLHLQAAPIPTASPGATTAAGALGRALILGVFAFMGMETPLSASGEVRAPNRTIPRALLLGLSVVTLLYVAIQLIAQHLLGAQLPHSAAPLADAMGRLHPALRALMLAGTAVSMLGFLSGDLLATPRVLFALARDGLLPAALGRLHRRSHAPYVAILLYAAAALLLALSGTFAELALLSSLAVAALYILACAAAWQLRRRAIALAGEPLNLPALGLIATLAIGSMLVMIALASRAELAGLLAVLVLAVIGYRLARLSSSPNGQ